MKISLLVCIELQAIFEFDCMQHWWTEREMEKKQKWKFDSIELIESLLQITISSFINELQTKLITHEETNNILFMSNVHVISLILIQW